MTMVLKTDYIWEQLCPWLFIVVMETFVLFSYDNAVAE